MEFYVYILRNETDNELYKGFTTNPIERLSEHNQFGTRFTATKSNWSYLFIKKFPSKRDALIFEKRIKKWNNKSIYKLINSNENQIQEFI